MDLSLITELTSTQDIKEVNQHLAAGWVLVSVADGRDSDGYPVTWYALGFPGRANEDRAPEREML